MKNRSDQDPTIPLEISFSPMINYVSSRLYLLECPLLPNDSKGLGPWILENAVAYNPFIFHLSVLKFYSHFRPNPSLDVGATAFAGQGLMFRAYTLSETAGMAGTMALALSLYLPFRRSLAFLFSHSLVSSLNLYNCSYPFHSVGFIACF